MKRTLLSYEDLTDEQISLEDGEIIEDSSKEYEKIIDSSGDEEEFGQKPVLPVGKFDSSFKDGDEATCGEQYLCIVQAQRKKLGKVLRKPESSNDDNNGNSVKIFDLLGRYGLKTAIETVSVNEEWAEKYWQCYKRGEESFLKQLNSLDDSKNDLDQISGLSAQELMNKFYEDVQIEPTISFLRDIKSDQSLCERLLNLHIRWIRDEEGGFENNEENLNRLFNWIQALLMCRDDRLSSMEVACLRQLAAELVKQFGAERTEVKEIVLVIAKKYGQIDLIK